MRRLLISSAALACGMSSAWSQPMTVEQLWGLCIKPSGTADQISCGAYLLGMTHGLQTGTVYTKRGQPFCIPEGLTSGQAIQMFNRTAAQNPQMQKEISAL